MTDPTNPTGDPQPFPPPPSRPSLHDRCEDWAADLMQTVRAREMDRRLRAVMRQFGLTTARPPETGAARR